MFSDMVASYRLVYSSVAADIINDDGVIPSRNTIFTLVTKEDVLSGSLEPQTPNSEQSVTFRLTRAEPCYPLFFTIAASTNVSQFNVEVSRIFKSSPWI